VVLESFKNHDLAIRDQNRNLVGIPNNFDLKL
jgi:hypothetical protein